MDYLRGAVRKLLKKSSILYGKKCDIVVSFNSEKGTEVAKLARDFDIATTLTTVSKTKDKIISLFLFRAYAKNTIQ